MKKKILITLWLIFLSSGVVQAMTKDEALEHFVKANILYKQESYDEAIRVYQQILASGWESGPFYYNLGNSYFKAGDLGKAILYYEKAQRFIPRDADLKANLKFALSQTPGLIQDELAVLWQRALQRVFAPFTSDEMALAILVLVALMIFLHLGPLYFRWQNPFAKYGLVVVASAIIMNMAVLALRTHHQQGWGIIVISTDAKFEPREGATTYFELSVGQRVQALQAQGDWLKIRRPDSKTGWIRRADLELIS